MIFPNELQIQILTDLIAISNFEYFCTLRTVCKKWNIFIPPITHEAVISRLKSFDLKLGFTDWDETKWSKEFLPTYDDHTKTFTFLVDINYINFDWENWKKFALGPQTIDFIVFVEKTNLLTLIKISTKFSNLVKPAFKSDNIYKHDFDHKNNVCFKRVIKTKYVCYYKLYCLTIAAWKLYYILDYIDEIEKRFSNFSKDFMRHILVI
ncbi:2489_t:CDS:2 [Scutellospora calospora]|uniref:2489_t:CDS:1 n=1 Tax=Scutellospora calospora TaxID=85575 RepID=A0ACA9LTM1_9GLOM|nr:2489_t:CDS:2 [Scutellospora calospora]